MHVISFTADTSEALVGATVSIWREVIEYDHLSDFLYCRKIFKSFFFLFLVSGWRILDNFSIVLNRFLPFITSSGNAHFLSAFIAFLLLNLKQNILLKKKCYSVCSFYFLYYLYYFHILLFVLCVALYFSPFSIIVNIINSLLRGGNYNRTR